MESEKKSSIGKVTFIYILSSFVLIWLLNKLLYLLFYLSIQSAGAKDELFFNLGLSAFFLSGLISVFLGAKIACEIIKKHYDKKDSPIILKRSVIIYFLLNGISLLLNFMSYQKIDLSALFAFLSFVVINVLYYFSTKLFLKK